MTLDRCPTCGHLTVCAVCGTVREVCEATDWGDRHEFTERRPA